MKSTFLLILCFRSLVFFGQDLEFILDHGTWISTQTLTSKFKMSEKIILTSSNDSIVPAGHYQIKFFNNNKLYFAWFSNGNSFDESGNTVPAGHKFENSTWSYLIKGSMIKIFSMVTQANSGKTQVIEYYYKAHLNSNPDQLEFIPIGKKQFFKQKEY